VAAFHQEVESRPTTDHRSVRAVAFVMAAFLHGPQSAPRLRRRILPWAEIVTGAIVIVVLLAVLRGPLFRGDTTFIHDVLYWSFPIYHFLAENLLQGRLPYWNPFSHTGEPFYPVLLQLRMLEPASFFSLAVGSAFTSDLITLFNWDRVARGAVGAVGTYVFLRQWATHWVTRLSLLPVVFWSSLLLTSFRQTGAIDAFISGPYVAYFLFRILHFNDLRWVNWIGLGTAIGVSWQSYYFVAIWVFLLFAVVGFAAFSPAALRQACRAPELRVRAVVTAVLIGVMAMPNAVVLHERANFVFPARSVDHSYENRAPIGGPLQYEPGSSTQDDQSIFMPYDLVRYTGTFASIWDLVQLIVPNGNRNLRGHRDPGIFGRPSEAFIYLGLLVYGGALLGLIAGRDERKRVWCVIGGGFGLLLLGPAGGLHWLLYHMYPPLWFLRHTHLFINFFILAVLYLYVLGANRFVEWQSGPLFDADGRAGAWRSSRLAAGLTLISFVVFSYLLGLAILVAPTFSLAGDHWPAVGLGLVSVALLAIALRKILGGLYAFGGLLLVHALLVLTFSPLPGEFLARLAVFFVLPVTALMVVRAISPRLFRPALTMLLVVLAVDLADYLRSSRLLWSAPRPDRAIAMPATAGSPAFRNTRSVTLAAGALGLEEEQSIRYLEVAARVPSGFSSIRRPLSPDAFEGFSVDAALGSPRWNSLLMLRPYFDLIHAGIPPAVLEELFAINRPLLQFRTRASLVPQSAFASTLRALTPIQARDLKDVAMLHQPAPDSLSVVPTRPDARDAPTARIMPTRYDYNSLELSVTAPTHGFLCYADGYHRYWKASVDDARIPVLPANGNFKAIPIQRGSHVVRLTYDPVPFRVGLYLFFGTPAVAGMVLTAGRLRSVWSRAAGRGPRRVDRDQATTPPRPA
jgi:hypothetical protein